MMNLKFIAMFSILLLVGLSTPVFAQTDSESPVSVTVSADKTSYLFDEVATIQGYVSEEVFVMKPHFIPQEIRIFISGNSFEKSITLYPDSNLGFKITQNLQQVLGIIGGDYLVSVTYGDAVSQTIFSVTDELIPEEIESSQNLSITTDKLQYLPGSNVQITALSDFVLPLQSMLFEVHDPNGLIISAGNLFPINGKFSTNIFLDNVNPRFGTYEIIGIYSDYTTTTTFDLIKDVKEDKLISIWTDKDVYEPGDTVSISGRLNNFWISTFNIEIDQMKNLSFADSSGLANHFSDIVYLEGDSSFTYSFKIPEESGIGDYVIKVSNEIGSETKTFVVSENPEKQINSKKPLSAFTDSESYSIGDSLILAGKIANPVEKSEFDVTFVTFTISDSEKKPLEMIGFDRGEESPENNFIVVDEKFTIIPDASGSFYFELPITRSQFNVGTYNIDLKYNSLLQSVSFSVTDPVDISSMVLNLDKEVYGLNESVNLEGLLPPLGDPSVSISVTKPDGSIFRSSAIVDNQKFNWSWVTPVSEKQYETNLFNSKTLVPTNLGIYKINVSTPSFNNDIFFKVSLVPENDFISKSSLSVETDKSFYAVGEKLKISGNVLPPSKGGGFTGHERIYLQIMDLTSYSIISESAVYPNQGGEFESSFELPVGVYSSGLYKVKAKYYGFNSESTFNVFSDFDIGHDERSLELMISTDKSQYRPGDVVTLSGKPNKLIYLDKFDVSVIQKSDTEVTCGSFICGVHQGPITSILPSPSGSFEYSFTIDNSDSSLGLYEITVDADFETKSLQFSVVSPPKLDTFIEKETRISEKNLSILTEEKLFQDTSIAPRVLSGSLITPLRDDQSDVNLKVSTESGICIIGSDENCMVRDSTRSQGQIYETVIIDDMSFNVRYSGPDVRLEKFSILPVSSGDFLPDSNWNIDVIKDEQISRLYYKVTYKTLE